MIISKADPMRTKRSEHDFVSSDQAANYIGENDEE